MPEEIEWDEVTCCIMMLFNLSVHTTVRDQQRAFNITSLPSAVMICVTCMCLYLHLSNVFTHVFEDLCQDWVVYFSAMPSDD